MIPVSFTADNAPVLREAFAAVPPVDIAVDCALRGLAGAFYRNEPGQPGAFLLTVMPFHYFAGDSRAAGADRLFRAVGRHCLIMPSAPGWFERARDVLGSRLDPATRYSFSSASLSRSRLEEIFSHSPYRKAVSAVTVDVARAALSGRSNLLDLTHFRSAGDFLERGLAFGVSEKGNLVAAAYSSLAHESAVEVSVFVHPQHRRLGLATALSARFLIECLDRGLRPNWDAASLISCRLGEKMSLTPTGSYEALVVR